MSHLCRSLAVVFLFFLNSISYADDLVFAAAPRGTLEEERQTYQPIVDLLSKATGKKFVFRHSISWGGYSGEMRKDKYDIAFDGPHLISWRMDKLGHVPLVRLKGDLSFVVAARADDKRIQEIKDLAGRRVCGFASPNLATLSLYTFFPNPARQPVVIEVRDGFKKAYDGIIEKKCDAGVMQATLYKKFEAGPHKGQTRIVAKSKPMPNQGMSAGRRVTPEMRKKIVEALLGPEGQEATARLRKALKKELVPATSEEYKGLAVLLKDEIGFAL